MKVSIAIIAHNEAEWVRLCIESVLNQTRPADEVVLLAHNCTDETVAIAQQYPVRVVVCNEPGGITVARARTIEATTGDIVCSTDGDCWVDRTWVEKISAPLVENNTITIVGGYTKIENGIPWKFSSWWQFVVNRKLFNKKDHRFSWGSNTAFRKRDYEAVGGLMPFIEIKQSLDLNYEAEDLYLSLALQKIGTLHFATNAIVHTYLPPEKAPLTAQRSIVPKQVADNKKLFGFFKI